MMPQYRGMSRGLCSVLGSHGSGLGGTAALIRFTPDASRAEALRRWLLEESLPGVVRSSGLGSAHLLQGAQPAPMTEEQRIRGADRGVAGALVLTGYDSDAVAACADELCATGALPARGAGEVSCATYRLCYSLVSAEIGA